MFKWFTNWLYKVSPPKVVHYQNWGDGVKAKVGYAEDGSYKMDVQGEEYPYPGFPRGHVLSGPLAKIKHSVKNMVFNQVFAEIEKMAKEYDADMMPAEKMAPAVRELYRVMQVLENAEVVDDMKKRIHLIKVVMTFFLQEDDAYRFRWQWLMEHLDMKKVKLSEADKYYFRGKYFKVDHDKFDY